MMNGVSSGLAPARTPAYRRIRLAVVAASVVAAIVGSVLLAVQRSSEKVGVQTSSILAPALPELATGREVTTEIGGHTLKFSNLKKLYYPDDGVTKAIVTFTYPDSYSIGK